MSDAATPEERVAKLERKMEKLEIRDDSAKHDQCWVDDIAGSMSNFSRADYDDFQNQCQKAKQE